MDEDSADLYSKIMQRQAARKQGRRRTGSEGSNATIVPKPKTMPPGGAATVGSKMQLTVQIDGVPIKSKSAGQHRTHCTTATSELWRLASSSVAFSCLCCSFFRLCRPSSSERRVAPRGHLHLSEPRARGAVHRGLPVRAGVPHARLERRRTVESERNHDCVGHSKRLAQSIGNHGQSHCAR